MTITKRATFAYPDGCKIPFVTRQSSCLFPEVCSKSRQCENWLRNREGCEAVASRNKTAMPTMPAYKEIYV